MSILSYLYIFFQSNILEIPSALIFYRKKNGTPINSAGYVALVVTLSNLITHPLVFFGFMTSSRTYLESTIAAETFAILIESLLHFKFIKDISYSTALKNSFIGNLISWQVAPLLAWLLLKNL
jgi:hypothetical protein